MNQSANALFPFLLDKISDEELLIIHRELLAQHDLGYTAGRADGYDDGYHDGYNHAAEDYY